MEKKLEILSAPGIPKGCRPSQDAASYPVGIFKRLKGFRCRTGVLKVRNGHYKLVASVPVANASYRGGIYVHDDTTPYCVCAFRVSTATRIYILNLVTNAWTAEVTDTGNRFATDAWVNFACFDSSPATVWFDYIIAMNGTDVPRVIYTITPTPVAYIAYQPDTGTAPQRSIQLGVYSSLDLNNPLNAHYTITNSAANFTLASAAGSGVQTDNFVVSATSSTTVGDTATLAITNAASYVVCYGPQMLLCVEETSASWSFWDNVKIELYAALDLVGSPSYYTVHDPTDSAYSSGTLTETLDGTTIATKILALDTSEIPRYLETFSLRGFRLTYVGTVPGSTKTNTIYSFSNSGNIQGGTNLAYTYTNGATVESIPIFIPTTGHIGATLGTSVAGEKLNLPYKSTLYYTYLWSVLVPVLAEINKGAVVYNLYVQKPGFSDYEKATDNRMTASWDSGDAGAFWSPATASSVFETRPAVVLPESDNLGPPSGSCVTSTNNRLYVGTKGALYISEDGQPMRFSTRVRFLTDGSVDPISPAYNTFAGQSVKAIVPTPTEWNNLASTIVFTDQSAWMLSGVDASSLSRPSLVCLNGCPYPKTIAQWKGLVFFADQDAQVRAIAGTSVEDISLGKIDEQLDSETLGSGIATDGLYHLTTLETGDTVYTHYWTYDSSIGEWVEDDMGSGNAAGLIRTATKIIAISELGLVYTWEKPAQTTDDGTDIPVQIVSGDLGYGLASKCTVEDPSVYSESAQCDLDIALESDEFGMSSEGTIPVGSSVSGYGETSAGNKLITSGRYGRLTLSGNLKGGNTIRLLTIKKSEDYTQ